MAERSDLGGQAAGAWPPGFRCALAVTIDVDGRYGEKNYREPDDMYWISQTAYDPHGTERLLGILADRDVRATFCWVGRAAADHPEHVRSAVAGGHEIALHSWEHRWYNTMTPEAQRADMERTMEALARISGTTPVGHKTASWRYDAATHRIAQEMGLLWVMDEPGGDLPYLIAPDSGLPLSYKFRPRVGSMTTPCSWTKSHRRRRHLRRGARIWMSCMERAASCA